MVKFQLLRKSVREITCFLRKLLLKNAEQVIPGIDENICTNLKAPVPAENFFGADKFIPLAAKDSQWVGIEFLNPNFWSPLDEEDDSEENELQKIPAIDPRTEPIFLLFPGLNKEPLVKVFEAASTSEVTKQLLGQKANFCRMKNKNKTSHENRRLERVQEEKNPSGTDDPRQNSCLMAGICQILTPNYHTTKNYYFGTPFNTPNFGPNSILKYLNDIYSYSDEDSSDQYDDEDDEDDEDSKDEVSRHRKRRKTKSSKKCYPIDERSSLSINIDPIESSRTKYDCNIIYIDNRKKNMTEKLNKTIASRDSCFADEEDTLDFKDCKKRRVINKKKLKSPENIINECRVPFLNEIIIENTYDRFESQKQAHVLDKDISSKNNDSNVSVFKKGSKEKTLLCADCKGQSNFENKIANDTDAPVNIDIEQPVNVESKSTLKSEIDECKASGIIKVNESGTSRIGSTKQLGAKNKKNLLWFLFPRKWRKK